MGLRAIPPSHSLSRGDHGALRRVGLRIGTSGGPAGLIMLAVTRDTAGYWRLYAQSVQPVVNTDLGLG